MLSSMFFVLAESGFLDIEHETIPVSIALAAVDLIDMPN